MTVDSDDESFSLDAPLPVVPDETGDDHNEGVQGSGTGEIGRSVDVDGSVAQGGGADATVALVHAQCRLLEAELATCRAELQAAREAEAKERLRADEAHSELATMHGVLTRTKVALWESVSLRAAIEIEAASAGLSLQCVADAAARSSMDAESSGSSRSYRSQRSLRSAPSSTGSLGDLPDPASPPSLPPAAADDEVVRTPRDRPLQQPSIVAAAFTAHAAARAALRRPSERRVQPMAPSRMLSLPSPGTPEFAQTEARVTLLQAQWRMVRARGPYLMHRRRERVLDELVSTEHAYLASLQSLLADWRTPLLERCIVTEPEARELFSQVEVIALYNQTFLAELEHRRSLQLNSPIFDRVVGDVITSFADFLRSYVLYVNNYNAALLLLNRLQDRSKQFREFAKEAHGKGVEDLSSLLIRPIQRIPRYVLLLNELAKSTPEGHADTAHVRRALAKMRRIASELNESKRSAEALAAVVDLYNRLEPKSAPQIANLVAPHRTLIREGALVLRSDMTPSASQRTQHVSLLSDTLMLSRPRSKSTLQLDLFIRLENVSSVVPLPPPDGEAEVFAFLVDSAARNVSVILVAPTARERAEWVRCVMRAVQALSERWSTLDVRDIEFDEGKIAP
eukprot:CAMPEP_0170749456 /NCGR_PEP_ID=MMETSP0437-20130122/10405_1 /TAXON_ID=0 /ORGANISM="Sexangularia sp." /LENGTH=625 /DNA_ID=CAMNT_0011088381 /DNA_START=77 /DNA_END=1954 /DNA_ORIENTATION=+